jgi:DNA-binding CsgD family transcriptional regulator
MESAKQIIIILANTLVKEGLCAILNSYFAPIQIKYYTQINDAVVSDNESSVYYITNSETFAQHIDYFLPRKHKMLLVVQCASHISSNASHPIHSIACDSSIEEIIEQLQTLFSRESHSNQTESNKGLSSREIEVLQLVVKGFINKEIADKLSISLNTVLSHRKNVTGKLGIKTVSGLTYYAIMNGILGSDDIEN